MNLTRSQIFMISPKEFRAGHCALCGAAAMLKFCDTLNGQSYGDCCFGSLIEAERQLLAVPGLRPPERDDLLIDH